MEQLEAQEPVWDSREVSRRRKALLDEYSYLDPDNDGDFFSKTQELALSLCIQDGLKAEQSGGARSDSDTLERIKEGTKARMALFEVNMPFALYMARESVGINHIRSQTEIAKLGIGTVSGNAAGTYAPISRLKSPYADLEQRQQSALEAMWKATGTYAHDGKDKKSIARFTTYAAWAVQTQIQRDAVYEESPIRFPHGVDEHVRNTLYDTEHDSEGLPKDVERLVELSKYYDFDKILPLDIHDHLRDGDDDVAEELADIWPDTRETAHVEQEVDREMLRTTIRNVLDILSERQSGIISLKYGLDQTEPLSYEAVGEKYYITKEGVRQIILKAFQKLRHPSVSKYLVDFLNEDSGHSRYTGDAIQADLPQLSYPIAVEHYSKSRPIEEKIYTSREGLESWQAFKDEEWDDPIRFERDRILDDETFGRIKAMLMNVSSWHFDKRSHSKQGRQYSQSLFQRVETMSKDMRMSVAHVEHIWDSFMQETYGRLQDSLGENFSSEQVGRFFSALLKYEIDTPVMAASEITLNIPKQYAGEISHLTSNLDKGTIKIVGDVGDNVASGNSGVTIVRVEGNAGDYAGESMRDYAELVVTNRAGRLFGNALKNNASASALSAGSVGERQSLDAKITIKQPVY